MPDATDFSGMHAETALLLLGLDRVASRYERLGLQFADPVRVRQGARDGWAAWRGDPDRTAADPGAAGTIQGVLASALDDVGAHADVSRAVTWVRRFTVSDALYTPREAWTWPIARFTDQDATTLRTLGMRADAVAAVARARDLFVARQHEKQSLGDELESEPLTEWDLARYHDYHPDYEYVTPVSPLKLWLALEAFDACFRELTAALSGSELRLMSAWVAAVNEAKGGSPLPVPDADELRRRLAELPAWPDP